MFNNESLEITASFGAVYFDHDNVLELDKLIRLADEALYNAKGGGRDRYELIWLKNTISEPLTTK